jgi:ADP-heptose:LPS heptosyltransferase
VVVLQVGDLDDARQWRADRTAAVADALADAAGYGAAVVTGPAHVEDGRAVARLVRRAVLLDASGRLDLRELLALFAVLADRPGSFLLSGDTAPVHLAVAAGLRVVGLYGSQPARRTGPYGGLADVVSLEGALDCVPCRERVCPRRDAPRACMERIGVEDVLRRVGGAAERRSEP